MDDHLGCHQRPKCVNYIVGFLAYRQTNNFLGIAGIRKSNIFASFSMDQVGAEVVFNLSLAGTIEGSPLRLNLKLALLNRLYLTVISPDIGIKEHAPRQAQIIGE